MGIRVLLGDNGFLNVVWQFVPNATDTVTDILSSDIHIAVQIEFHGNTADLFTGFATENFNAGDIVDFLLHRFSDIRFHELRVGSWIDRNDGDNGGIDVGQFSDRETGKGHDANQGKGQIEHRGGHRAPNTELGKIHLEGEVGVGLSVMIFRPGESRRLPDRATWSPALRPLRISTVPAMRMPVSTGTNSAIPLLDR